MRIHCDACRAPMDETQAVVLADQDGEIFYFCSEECAETSEELDPDRELERVDAPPR